MAIGELFVKSDNPRIHLPVTSLQRYPVHFLIALGTKNKKIKNLKGEIEKLSEDEKIIFQIQIEALNRRVQMLYREAMPKMSSILKSCLSDYKMRVSKLKTEIKFAKTGKFHESVCSLKKDLWFPLQLSDSVDVQLPEFYKNALIAIESECENLMPESEKKVRDCPSLVPLPCEIKNKPSENSDALRSRTISNRHLL